MRPALALSIVLLALTLALNQASALFPREDRAPTRAPLELLVGAKGPLLPPAFVGSGPERMGEAMRVGDRTLVAEPGASGLRAAFLGADFALREERCFDIAASSEDVHALAARVAAAGWGELLLLASSGTLQAAGEGAEARSAELAAVLATLGARAHPGAHTPESWALIALRLEGGWVPLAEGYGQHSGVVLSFLVSPAFEDYDGFRGDLALVPAPEHAQVFLEDELGHASRRDAGTELARDRSVGGVPRAGILQRPTSGADGRAAASSLAWSDVAIGAGTGLWTLVGLADGTSPGADGVVFEVRVDGRSVQSLTVLPGMPWQVMEVDLRPFAGRSVELELVVDPRAGADGDLALWGRPMLLHGYDRSPFDTLLPQR